MSELATSSTRHYSRSEPFTRATRGSNSSPPHLLKVHDPQFVPIEFEFDKKARKARIAIAGAVETVSGPLILPNTGQEHRVTVRLPEGREYLEMEVAQAMVLKGTGAIRFEHRNTHSSMAEVTYTHEVG